MSEITDFLSGLTIEQLEFAKAEATGLIAKKQAATKFVIWQVCDAFAPIRNFTQKNYLKAAEYLLMEANSRQGQTKEYAKQLGLQFILVAEDDLPAYLSEEEAKAYL